MKTINCGLFSNHRKTHKHFGICGQTISIENENGLYRRAKKDKPNFSETGLDGVGLGLTLHHKALGKVFEVWCLHIPVYDRTPFEGLVKFVEETVRLNHASSPNKPIYPVGDSFGRCLALAVAACNPKIDLVVIVANPATFGRSQLQPLLPVLEGLPEGLHNAVPYLLSCVMGNPLRWQ